MITITLPNKDKKQYKKPVTSAEIANDISEKLASDALVSIVNGELWDLDRLIEIDSTISDSYTHLRAHETSLHLV